MKHKYDVYHWFTVAQTRPDWAGDADLDNSEIVHPKCRSNAFHPDGVEHQQAQKACHIQDEAPQRMLPCRIFASASVAVSAQ